MTRAALFFSILSISFFPACFFVDADKIEFTCALDGETCPGGQVCLDQAICIEEDALIPSVDPIVKETPFDQALITGKALRGATVRAFIDGELVGEAQVDPDPDPEEIFGDFSLFAQLKNDENAILIEAELATVFQAIDVDLNENPLLVLFDENTPLFLEEANERGLDFVVLPLGEALDNMGATFQDLDNDTDLDLVIGSDPEGVIRVNANGVFSQGPLLSTQVAAAFADFDEDGDLDVAASSSDARGRAFSNFLEQGELAFGNEQLFNNAENSEGVTLLDFNAENQAGFVDILFQDGGENRFEINEGNGAFLVEDANLFLSAKQGGTDANANGSFLASCDFDSDGFVDVLVNDKADHQFFLTLPNGEIIRILGEIFDDTANLQRGLSFADFDQNGVFDIVVALGNQGVDVISLARQGNDINTQLLDSLNANADGVGIGDFDFDGDLDILLSGDDGKDHLFLNKAGLQGGPAGDFLDASDFLNDAGDGEGVAIGDIDNDGSLDAFVVDQAQDSRLYLNVFENEVHFRTLRIVREVNGQLVDVLGTTVLLEENTESNERFFAIRHVDGGSGHGSQEALTLHFGGTAPRRTYLATITVPGCVPTQILLEPEETIFSFEGDCP